MATQGTRQIKNLRIRWERVERRERFERRVSRSTILLCLLVASLSLPAFGQTELTLWHTLGVGGTEEQKLTEAVEDFERAHRDTTVKITRIPYAQNLAQFINAAQAGTSPDVVRVSDSELGKMGDVRVNGAPILEDLGAHYTPVQKQAYALSALAPMRVKNRLLALPASGGSLALVYNKRLFDEAGLAYPSENWTTDDFLSAAKTLSSGEVKGITVPLKWSYWLLPFLSGFGGPLFDNETPLFASASHAEGLDFYLDLDRVYGVAAPSSSPEVMTTTFQRERAAMVIDGVWNYQTYADAGIDIGVALLPRVSKTGQRMRPLGSYFGWAMSKTASNKIRAAELIEWLSSASVQKRLALEANVTPSAAALADDVDVQSSPVYGFMRQSQYTETIPTNRGSSQIYLQLDTALELVSSGELTAAEAMRQAQLAYLETTQ